MAVHSLHMDRDAHSAHVQYLAGGAHSAEQILGRVPCPPTGAYTTLYLRAPTSVLYYDCIEMYPKIVNANHDNDHRIKLCGEIRMLIVDRYK